MASLRQNYQKKYGYSYYAIRRIARDAGHTSGIRNIPEKELRALIAQHRARLSDGCVWKHDTRTLRLTRLAHRANISPSAIMRRLKKQNLRIGDLTDAQVIHAVQHVARAPWGTVKSRNAKGSSTSANTQRVRAIISREPITLQGPNGQTKTLSLCGWARMIGISDRSIVTYAIRNHEGDRVAAISKYLERHNINLWTDASGDGGTEPHGNELRPTSG